MKVKAPFWKDLSSKNFFHSLSDVRIFLLSLFFALIEAEEHRNKASKRFQGFFSFTSIFKEIRREEQQVIGGNAKKLFKIHDDLKIFKEKEKFEI